MYYTILLVNYFLAHVGDAPDGVAAAGSNAYHPAP